MDESGNPFVYSPIDAQVVPVATQPIRDVVTGAVPTLSVAATDEPNDDGDALALIDYLSVNTTTTGCAMAVVTVDTDGDGIDETFPAVGPGSSVCWDVVPVQLQSVVPATSATQVLHA